jgi:hypothetical protein
MMRGRGREAMGSHAVYITLEKAVPTQRRKVRKEFQLRNAQIVVIQMVSMDFRAFSL